MKYYISTNDLYIPKLFSARPNIIKNWLTELYELSKSDNRNSFMLFCPTLRGGPSKLLFFFPLFVTFLTFTFFNF